MKKETLSTEFEDYFEMTSLKKTFEDMSGGAHFEDHLPNIRKEAERALPFLMARALAQILEVYVLKYFKPDSEKGNTHVCTDPSSTHH